MIFKKTKKQTNILCTKPVVENIVWFNQLELVCLELCNDSRPDEDSLVLICTGLIVKIEKPFDRCAHYQGQTEEGS